MHKKRKLKGETHTFFDFLLLKPEGTSLWGNPETQTWAKTTKWFDKSIPIDFRTSGTLAVTVYDLRMNFCINQSQSEDLQLGAKLKTPIELAIAIANCDRAIKIDLGKRELSIYLNDEYAL